jgi:putative FmdB family regulatory protein
MPIYEYQCQACGHHLEKLQKMSDDPLKDCPNCEQSTLSKQISAAGFRLKGTGWYETDFKNKKPKTESTPSQTKNEKSVTKTETK